MQEELTDPRGTGRAGERVAPGTALRLRVTRGPLPDEALDAVGTTYGTVDRRYASRGFCREMFNGNPFGYSWHAFIHDGKTAVGHYAVIPVRARAGESIVTAGRGEALFLEETCRAARLEGADGPTPAGIALMAAVHERALAEGAQILHNRTSPEIGMIQRMQ